MPIRERVRKTHVRALLVSETYLRCEADLIDIFQIMEETKGYRDYGRASLYAYGTTLLKLSEHAVLDLINVARKARAVPELKASIRAQKLTVSKARKITPVLTSKNQAAWIALAETSSTRAIEKEVAREKPETLIPERAVYKTADRLELKLGVSEELMQKLARIKDLESQKKGRAVSLEEALEAMSDVYLHKHDPLEKAARAKNKVVKNQAVESAELVTGRAIPARTLHELQRRCDSRCTHVDPDGQRCESRRWLHVHHIVPRELGGGDELSNLTLLCAGHHQLVHHEPTSTAVARSGH